MLSIILEKPERLASATAAEPPPPVAGEALVRVLRVGVCGTDIHAFRGRQPFFQYPRILGHELAVEVLAVGPGVNNVHVGDLCAVEPYLNCGQCIACRRARGNCCTQMRVLGVHIDGGMRERFTLPANKLHIADGLHPEQAALVETLAIGAHAVARAAIEPGEQVLVAGAGPIGLATMQFALAATGTGGKVIAVDVNRQRLDFCRDALGITHTVVAGADAAAEIAALTGGENCTAVFDATGNAASMRGSLDFVANSGRLVYVGLFQGDFSLPDPDFHRRETTLMGSRNALPADFSRIIRMVKQKQINTAPWITHRLPATELAQAFAGLIAQPQLLKAMVAF